MQKTLAGLISGAIGVSLGNPFEVVKVLLQTQGTLPKAEQPYSGSYDCFSKVYNQYGALGFWKGWPAIVVCSSIINAVIVATYD